VSREAVVRSAAPGGSKVLAESGPHRLVGDLDETAGGGDEGPDPHDFLCVALGACTSMTLQLYAKRKQWPLESVVVKVRHKKGDPQETMERDVTLVGSLDAEQRARLLEIANKCPVHRTLTASVKVETKLVPM
jgi:putative redox protein